MPFLLKADQQRAGLSESSAPQWAGTDLIMPLYSFYSPRPSFWLTSWEKHQLFPVRVQPIVRLFPNSLKN